MYRDQRCDSERADPKGVEPAEGAGGVETEHRADSDARPVPSIGRARGLVHGLAFDPAREPIQHQQPERVAKKCAPIQRRRDQCIENQAWYGAAQCGQAETGCGTEHDRKQPRKVQKGEQVCDGAQVISAIRLDHLFGVHGNHSYRHGKAP